MAPVTHVPQPEAGGSPGYPALQPEAGDGGGQEQGQAGGPAEQPPARRHPPAREGTAWGQGGGTEGDTEVASPGDVGGTHGDVSGGHGGTRGGILRGHSWGHLGGIQGHRGDFSGDGGGTRVWQLQGIPRGTSPGLGGYPPGWHFQGMLGTLVGTSLGDMGVQRGGISRATGVGERGGTQGHLQGMWRGTQKWHLWEKGGTLGTDTHTHTPGTPPPPGHSPAFSTRQPGAPWQPVPVSRCPSVPRGWGQGPRWGEEGNKVTGTRGSAIVGDTMRGRLWVLPPTC